MTWATEGREEPYFEDEIQQEPCVRCAKPALHQWQVCADGNRYRALCLDCDIELNLLVLTWARDPRAAEKVATYEEKARAA